MKHFFSYTFIFCLCLLFFSCNSSLKEENEDLKIQVTNLLKENKRLTLELSEVQNKAKSLQDTIMELKYPPNERLQSIKTSISKDEFSQAKQQIRNLQQLYPLSQEAQQASLLLTDIEKKEELKEKERIAKLTKISPTILGITLGEDKETTFNKLKKQGIYVKSTTLGGDGEMYNTSNISLFNVKWQDLTIGFKANKLYSICVSSATGSVSKANQLYNQLLISLKSKYGNYQDQSPDFTYWEDQFTSLELYHSDINPMVYINYESK